MFPLLKFRLESEKPTVKVDSMPPERPFATLCCPLRNSEGLVSRVFVITLELGSHRLQVSATVSVALNLSHIHKLMSLETGNGRKRKLVFGMPVDSELLVDKLLAYSYNETQRDVLYLTFI